MEAAKKAKAKNNKKKGKDLDDEDDKIAVDSDESEKAEEVYDLQTADGFRKALRAKVPMPFIFGPVEFTGLNNSQNDEPFDFELERENVITLL